MGELPSFPDSILLSIVETCAVVVGLRGSSFTVGRGRKISLGHSAIMCEVEQHFRHSPEDLRRSISSLGIRGPRCAGTGVLRELVADIRRGLRAGTGGALVPPTIAVVVRTLSSFSILATVLFFTSSSSFSRSRFRSYKRMSRGTTNRISSAIVVKFSRERAISSLSSLLRPRRACSTRKSLSGQPRIVTYC
jgi:hypothetical protein